MAEYANKQFETYVKEADLKQQILMENPAPDNLDHVKKLDDFVHDILEDKYKQKDLDMDVIEFLCDGPSAEVIDVSGRGM